MNPKRSAADSKRWRSQSSAMLPLTDQIKMDLPYRVVHEPGTGLSV
jgi:hypothetical protein